MSSVSLSRVIDQRAAGVHIRDGLGDAIRFFGADRGVQRDRALEASRYSRTRRVFSPKSSAPLVGRIAVEQFRAAHFVRRICATLSTTCTGKADVFD